MVKSSELKVRVEPDLHEQFKEICIAEEKKVSEVIRELMHDYVENYQRRVQKDLFLRDHNNEG